MTASLPPTPPPTPTPPASGEAFDPVLLDLPGELRTTRLRLRAPRPGDGPELHAAVLETLASLRRFPASMPWAMEAPTVAAMEAYARRSVAGWALRTDLPLLGMLQRTDELVLSCGVHRIDWSRRSFELGWWVRRSHQGRGYAAEAARALVGFCFEYLGAERVQCLADAENEASARVALAAGLRQEGTLRSERADSDGSRRDMTVFAMTGDDWRQRADAA